MSDAVTDDATGAEGSASGSPGRAVAAAVGLGILGPLLALVFAVGLGLLNALLELPLAVTLVLGLFLGQYVAFGGLAVGYLASRGLDLARIRSYLGVEWPTLTQLGIVIGGWVAIIVLLVLVATIVQAFGAEPAGNQSAELAMNNPAIIPLLILASFLVIGPSEEILYRGVVQGRLREALSPAPAILLASVVFAVIHVLALTGGITARLTTVAILFVPSIVLGIVYEYTGNLVVPVLLHGLHNAVLFTLLYVVLAYGDEFGAGGMDGGVSWLVALPV